MGKAKRDAREVRKAREERRGGGGGGGAGLIFPIPLPLLAPATQAILDAKRERVPAL